MATLRLTRRQLLVAGGAGLVLAACGGDDEGAEGATSTTRAAERDERFQLYRVFEPEQPAGKELRLPLALAASDGSLDVTGPRTIDVRVVGSDGTSLGEQSIARRDEGIPRAYYPLGVTLPSPGTWQVQVVAGSSRVATTVTARPASELPAVPAPGDPLPRIPTPTTSDDQGVDPICTRESPCPFHDRSLDTLVGGRSPIVLLVSTPAFCQTAICGPVLELLIERRRDLEEAGVGVVHAEVYVNDRAEQVTSTVSALGLRYEPALFLAAPDGTVSERLDYTFDRTELDEALSRLIP